MAHQIFDRWGERYQSWIDKRLPPTQQILLSQANVFIFLSPQGAQFLILILLLWLGATNYQNNLVYGLSFLLLAVLFVVIHFTFANVSGLKLSFLEMKPVFAGDVARLSVMLESRRARHQIMMGWVGETQTLVEVPANQPTRCILQVHTVKRGVYHPGRFLLKSTFPMGLVQCWTWLDPDTHVLVYPQPIEDDHTLFGVGTVDQQGVATAGSDDYFALKPFSPGHPLSRIAWKQHAAGRGLFIREYVDYRGDDLWLDYHVMVDADPELRLSKLCFYALQLHEKAQPFGLRLPDITIEPATGQTHRDAVLEALARCNV